MTRTKRTRSGERGFSLAEILTATAIFAIIFIAALMVYDRSNRVYKQGVEAADMQQNTRVAFDKLVADLRMSGFDFDRDGSPMSTLSSTWQPSSPYSIGNLVEPDPPNGYVYRCITGGNSAPTAPTWDTAPASQTTENAPSTVRWQLVDNVQYQQPDEQVEYAGSSVIGVRANFDYETDLGQCVAAGAQCENGRETGYESDAFPVVTTGNDEIVVYALRPVNVPGGGLPQLTFFADMAKPRRVNPGTGRTEDTINLPRVYDPCVGGCNNPPYTLYRISFTDANGINFVETPLAENIRSMTFRYFRDMAATDEITTLPDGAGAYNGASPNATVAGRDTREEIRAVRINLIGMAPQPDRDFTDAADAVAPQYRKYQLETLIVPRNIGRHGMREFSTDAPGAPTLNTVCPGSCNAVYLSWDAAPTGGEVESYNILYDTDVGSCSGGIVNNLTFAEDAGRNLDGYAATWIDPPGVRYYFAVQAINRYGSATSNCIDVMVKNTTKPEQPGNLDPSGVVSVTHPPESGKITLYWPPVSTNDDSEKTVTCSDGSVRDTKNMPAPERRFYRLYKSKTASFTPSTANEVLNEFSATQPTFDGTSMLWTDTATANCKNYYYKIRAVDFCGRNATYNKNDDISIGQSRPFPASGDDGKEGRAVRASGRPAAPQGFAKASDTCASGVCDVVFSWSAVNTNEDTTGPIYIDDYVMRAEEDLTGTGSWLAPTLIAAEFPFTNGALTGQIDDIPQGVAYRFFLKAKDCVDGAETAPLYYPCTWSGGAVTVTPLDTFGGSGTAADPWVIENPASLTVTTGNPVAKVEATVFQGSPEMQVGTTFVQTGPLTSASVPLPDVADGTPARVAITITDASASACPLVFNYYVIDQPPPLCTLDNVQNDSSVMTWPTAGDDRVVTVNLDNTSASDDVVVKRIIVNWNRQPSGTNNAADRLISATFPTGTVTMNCDLGTTVIDLPGATSAAGTGLTINPLSATSFTVTFRRAKTTGASSTRPINTNPVTGICVDYQGRFGDRVFCTIVPGPGTCPVPDPNALGDPTGPPTAAAVQCQ